MGPVLLLLLQCLVYADTGGDVASSGQPGRPPVPAEPRPAMSAWRCSNYTVSDAVSTWC